MSKITITSTPIISSILLGNGETVTKYHDSLNRLHRLDGPAVKTSYSEEWWKDGKMHRKDGPAVFINKPYYIRAEWWEDGVLNRENNKPAIIDSDGVMEYWIRGEKVK